MEINKKQMLEIAESAGIPASWIESGSYAASNLRLPYLQGKCELDKFVSLVESQLQANNAQREHNLSMMQFVSKLRVIEASGHGEVDRDPLPFGRDDES